MDEVDVVEVVEDPAAVGRTEAIVTGAIELVVDVEVMEVLVDAGAEVMDEELVDAVDDVVKGTAGVGGASRRINIAKFSMSELKSDAALALWPPSVDGTVSSGKGAGEHAAGTFASGSIILPRSLGNRSLVTPSSTL